MHFTAAAVIDRNVPEIDIVFAHNYIVTILLRNKQFWKINLRMK